MQSGSNKTSEILSNGIVKFLQEMGVFGQLHFSFGCIFICSLGFDGPVCLISYVKM